MHLGVIGVGRIGAYHAAILRDTEGVHKVSVSDADAERARDVAGDLGIDVAADVPTLLTQVDAVVITAATSAHAELITLTTSAGLPTFCEKPITLDLPSTAAVVDHVAATGVVVQMGFQRRFDAGYRAARKLVGDGSMGQLYVIRMAGHDPAPPPASYIAHSGGLFRDFGVHDFDALRFVTGQEVVEVYADGAVLAFEVFEEFDDIDTGVAILTLESGVKAILSSTRHDPLGYDVRMELFGSSDSVVVGWDDRLPLRSIEPGGPAAPTRPYRNFQERFRAAYVEELRVFVRVAKGEEPNPCTVHDAQQALRVAAACDLSRFEHRPVRLEELS